MYTNETESFVYARARACGCIVFMYVCKSIRIRSYKSLCRSKRSLPLIYCFRESNCSRQLKRFTIKLIFRQIDLSLKRSRAVAYATTDLTTAIAVRETRNERREVNVKDGRIYSFYQRRPNV